MGSTILKITGLRCVFTTLRGVRMVSTMNDSSSITCFSFFNSADDKTTQTQFSRFSALPPWLMLSPRSQDTTYKLYNFAENKVLCIAKPDLKEEYESTNIFGSSHGWLACFNHLRGGEVFLSNPLTGRRVNLPPIDNLPEIPEYNLKHGKGCISKILISCSDPESEECRVMMSFGWVNRLAFCCPGGKGRSSDQWTVIGSEKERSYEDFVYCSTHELLISVKYYKEELEAWDLRDPMFPRLVWSHRARAHELLFQKRKYLVASQQGEHFIVCRYINALMLPDGSSATFDPRDCWMYPSKTIDFSVQKIVGEGKLVEMDGHLDGLVMFVGGLSHGMAMPASDARGFQPNSICFTDDACGPTTSEYGTDNGIFDFEKRTFSSCYYPCDDYQSLKNYILPPPLWFTPSPKKKVLL